MPCRFPTPPFRRLHRLLRCGVRLLLSLLPPSPRIARETRAAALRLPLEHLGFQPLSNQFLLDGSSMLTLHYVDDQHLLLTFVVHRLIRASPTSP